MRTKFIISPLLVALLSTLAPSTVLADGQSAPAGAAVPVQVISPSSALSAATQGNPACGTSSSSLVAAAVAAATYTHKFLVNNYGVTVRIGYGNSSITTSTGAAFPSGSWLEFTGFIGAMYCI
jgi:hypothetical protein